MLVLFLAWHHQNLELCSSDFGFVIYIRIHFATGVSRSCGTTVIPGNTYVDKLEREVELYFYIEDSEFSDFVEFERASAWLYISDDDGT